MRVPLPVTTALAPLAAAAVLACSSSDVPTAPGADPTDPRTPLDPVAVRAPVLALVDVRVVDVLDGSVRAGRTVVVRDGVVAEVGSSDSVAVPAGALVPDVAGAWVLPGLADMHVHLRREDLPAYLRAGVTTVRNMWGWDGAREMMDGRVAGDLLAPRIHSVSPGLDDLPVHWPHTRLVRNPVDARAVVEAEARDGWPSVKVYQDLTLEAYDSIVAAADDLGVGFEGHVPTRVSFAHALEAGQRSVEHLGGFAEEIGGWTPPEPAAVRRVVEAVAASDTRVCPTLAILGRLPGGSAAAPARRALVAELDRAGARLLVGTDAGIGVVEPGAGLHEEMAEFRAAGLEPARILRLVTVEAARYLGVADRSGRVAPGLRGDLLVVSEDPTVDLGTLRKPVAVVLEGTWIPLGG